MASELEKLVEVMNDQLQWHRDLAAVLENKLDAVRHYDASRLEALCTAEQRLMEMIHTNESKRVHAVRLATGALLPQQRGRLATARELILAAPEPVRSKLSAVTALLCEATEKMRRLNRISELASRKIMGHFDHIFRIIAQSGCDIGLYGRAGKKDLLEQNRLIDAVA